MRARFMPLAESLRSTPVENEKLNGDRCFWVCLRLSCRRFVRYNGGVGVRQLAWLEEQLAQASRAGQRVVGFSHVPIHPAEPSAHTLLWNYEDVSFAKSDSIDSFGMIRVSESRRKSRLICSFHFYISNPAQGVCLRCQHG